MAVQQQLSGTIVVIIIAMAVQVCIMLVIVVKRQIMRFALRNRRGPHTHIGQGAPKVFRRETDRQLEYVAYIRHEPGPYELEGDENNYRVCALKELRSLEEEIAAYNVSYLRPPCGNMRSFLLNCTHGPLLGVDSHHIHLLCDEYEHARHHYEAFDEAKFKVNYKCLKITLKGLKDYFGVFQTLCYTLSGIPNHCMFSFVFRHSSPV